MKINLNGIFKDIKHIVDAPSKPDVKAPSEYSFDKILASISPRKEELLKQIRSLTGQTEVIENMNKKQNETMASIRFDSPQMEAPEILPIQIVGGEEENESGSVKTPALLEARRLPADTYTMLQKPQRISAINDLAKQYGTEQGIDPVLSMSIIANESNFETRAVSQDGHNSKGLMQLLDSTGTQYHEQFGVKGKYDPFNPDQNVKLGVSYLRYLHDIFSKETTLPNEMKTVGAANSSSLEKLAVAAFNAGEGRVASAQARAEQSGADPSIYDQVEAYLPESTRSYVHKVMRSKLEFAADLEGES